MNFVLRDRWTDHKKQENSTTHEFIAVVSRGMIEPASVTTSRTFFGAS